MTHSRSFDELSENKTKLHGYAIFMVRYVEAIYSMIDVSFLEDSTWPAWGLVEHFRSFIMFAFIRHRRYPVPVTLDWKPALDVQP